MRRLPSRVLLLLAAAWRRRGLRELGRGRPPPPTTRAPPSPPRRRRPEHGRPRRGPGRGRPRPGGRSPRRLERLPLDAGAVPADAGAGRPARSPASGPDPAPAPPRPAAPPGAPRPARSPSRRCRRRGSRTSRPAKATGCASPVGPAAPRAGHPDLALVDRPREQPGGPPRHRRRRPRGGRVSHRDDRPLHHRGRDRRRAGACQDRRTAFAVVPDRLFARFRVRATPPAGARWPCSRPTCRSRPARR